MPTRLATRKATAFDFQLMESLVEAEYSDELQETEHVFDPQWTRTVTYDGFPVAVYGIMMCSWGYEAWLIPAREAEQHAFGIVRSCKAFLQDFLQDHPQSVYAHCNAGSRKSIRLAHAFGFEKRCVMDFEKHVILRMERPMPWGS